MKKLFLLGLLISVFQLSACQPGKVSLESNLLWKSSMPVVQPATRVMDRVQMVDHLVQISSPISSDVQAIDLYRDKVFEMARASVLAKSEEMGRPCLANESNLTMTSDRDDRICNAIGVRGEVVPALISIREITRIGLCERIVPFSVNLMVAGVSKSHSAALGFAERAVARATAGPGTPGSGNFTSEALLKGSVEEQRRLMQSAYSLFMGGVSPSAQQIQDLIQIATQAKPDSGPQIAAAWRAVMITLCYSPEWQVL
jgi:hypothetical protein